MNVDYVIRQLDNAAAWRELSEALGGDNLPVVRGVIRHLRILEVVCYVVESRYIDRDYSADYLRFYAQTFRSYERHCRRVHFFAADISESLARPRTQNRIESFQELAGAGYRGFCVVRPLASAPIGRTVLAAGCREPFDTEAIVTCRAGHDANLFGIDLQVTGTAFLQQDARVGACAQVAVWAGIRHMHARYGYNWVSVADITRLAAPTTASEATSLPAGSDFLTSERMIRAIDEIGFQPLCFRGRNLIGEAILPYVESGIPVIVGLSNGGALGHAVTVVGRVFSKLSTPKNTAIDYVSAYIVHDDQAGPYMLTPTKSGLAANKLFKAEDFISHALNGQMTDLNMHDHAVFAVALMPRKVFSTAQSAEFTARNRIDAILNMMSRVRQDLAAKQVSVNDRLMDELETAYSADEVVLRTYLTSAAGYRRHIARGTASEQLKDVLLSLHLPHFTWVTEISTTGSYNQQSPGLRRIYGHAVVDATSTGKDKSGLLILHLPGIVVMNDVDASPEKAEQFAIIDDDRLYEWREKRP